MNTLQSQVGARIRELREQKGISQEALAAICNLHRTYIGLIERGKRSLSLTTVEQIASGLGIAPYELFSSAKGPAKTAVRDAGKKRSAAAPTMQELAAEVAALRQLLTEAKVIDPKRYEDVRRRHLRGGAASKVRPSSAI
jgi:transcriptional regulator with XRE-family HTH domain